MTSHTRRARCLRIYLAHDLHLLGTPAQPFVYANFVSSLDGRIRSDARLASATLARRARAGGAHHHGRRCAVGPRPFLARTSMRSGVCRCRHLGRGRVDDPDARRERLRASVSARRTADAGNRVARRGARGSGALDACSSVRCTTIPRLPRGPGNGLRRSMCERMRNRVRCPPGEPPDRDTSVSALPPLLTAVPRSSHRGPLRGLQSGHSS